MIASVIDSVAAWATSHTTLYWLSWAGIGLALVGILTLIWAVLGIVRDFDEAHLLKQQRGPRARRARTIRRNITKFQQYANSVVQTIAMRSAGLMVIGIGLPGLLLGVIAFFQPWFIPDEAVLLLDGEPARADTQSVYQLSVFVLDQALRGGLSDVFEVFGLRLSAFENNPSNILFSSLTLGYRLICGLVFTTMVFVIGRIAIGYRNLSAAIAQLQAQLETAS